MSDSPVSTLHTYARSIEDPASSSGPPCPGLAALPADVLAEVAAQLAVADVGNLLLTSKAVRDSVRDNEPLWASQYAVRWVRFSETCVKGPTRGRRGWWLSHGDLTLSRRTTRSAEWRTINFEASCLGCAPNRVSTLRCRGDQLKAGGSCTAPLTTPAPRQGSPLNILPPPSFVRIRRSTVTVT